MHMFASVTHKETEYDFSANRILEQKHSTAITRRQPLRKTGLLGILQDRHYISTYRTRALGKPVRKQR